MTISSEIHSLLLTIKSIDEKNFLVAIFEILKTVGLFTIKPITYFISFHWLNDILYRVNTIPINLNLFNQQSYIGLDATNLFQEHLTNPWIFNPIISGLTNGFFLCLPLTISHLYSIRETLTNNRKVGALTLASSVGGILTYNVIMVTGGFNLLNQWIRLDSFLYILTLGTILTLVYNQTELKLANLSTLSTVAFSEKGNWKTNIGLPFALSWMEQIVCLPYLTSITDPINNLWSYTNQNSLTTSIVYIISTSCGITIGVLFFSYGLNYVFQGIWNLVRVNPRIWREQLNNNFNILILVLTFASIPYYTLDYLMTNTVGLHSGEKVIQENADRYYQKLKTNPRELFNLEKIDYQSYDLQQPKILGSVEELEYRAEKDVENRFQRQASMANEKAKTFIRTIFQKLNIDITSTKNSTKTDPKQGATRSQQMDQNTQSGAFARTRRWKQLNRFDVGGSGSNAESPFHNIVTQYAFIDNSMVVPVEGLQAKIKSRYYENPIYKLLLKGDISLFLLNQPTTQFVNQEDYTDVLQKQRALKGYTNTLRQYRNLPYQNEFYEFFDGSKSFSNKLISHQAKGSLRIVRRLFRIDLTTTSDNKYEKTLRYDQPLYSSKDFSKIRNDLTHEELTSPTLQNYNLTKWEPIPIYMGWDESLRKYVLTNRYITYGKSSRTDKKLIVTSYPKETKNRFSSPKKLNNVLSIPNSDPRYKSLEKTLQTNLGYETVPVTATLFQKQEKLAPVDRGIFIWSEE